jgi:hypothetical protein
MIARLFVLALAWIGATPALAAEGDTPASYAVRLPVTPAAGSALQQLDLPARALIAAKSADMADVRMFNADGQPVPIALYTVPAAVQHRVVPLRVMPILGAADALAVTGVSLRIDERQRASVVRVDGTPQAAGHPQLLGVLLDARDIHGPASALSLDVDIPAGQPVTFTIERSTDLNDWQPLTEKVLYRTSDRTGAMSIPFPEQSLQDQYLRIMWTASSRLLSPVAINSARVVTQGNPSSSVPPRAHLAIPTSNDPRLIEFTIPFGARVSALQIRAKGEDTIVPIRILGRNRQEDAWTPIASGSVSRITRDRRTFTNPEFDMGESRFRTIRIEADARTPGFTAPPAIAALLAPVRIIFLASGPAPFTLAVGKADAQSVFLPAADLMQASGSGVATPPMAQTAGQADSVVVTTGQRDEGTPWRRVALWGVLLAGTALLAAMVWQLARRRQPAA